jgi:hypothetical protein
MNNSIIIANVWRFVFYFFLQVVVFKNLDFSIGNFRFIHLVVYPIALFMLPMKTPKALVLLIAFVYGLLIDSFYNSPGVHAAALVFSCYIKELILKFLEPFEGYNINDVPTPAKMGMNWYISSMSLLLFLHCFTYFSVEAFSFVYFFQIFLNTIFTLIASMLVILLFQLIFRPKY